MKKKEQNKLVKIIGSIIILVFLDLITKFYFTNKTFFKNSLISINYIQNYGSSFSMFSSITYYSLLIIFISVIALCLAIKYYKKINVNRHFTTVYILFIAGLIGNTYDRIVFGFVRDFISLKYLFVFNLADFYFTLAAIIYIVYEIKNKKKN
jgi:signal peptidase II